MNRETFTRAYLKGLPEEHRKSLIDTFIVHPHIYPIKRAAIDGMNTYVYYEENHIDNRNLKELGPITQKELIDGFKRVFPDCSISYEIVVNERISGLKISQGAIVIDWS
jgi:hypothetical protein